MHKLKVFLQNTDQKIQRKEFQAESGKILEQNIQTALKSERFPSAKHCVCMKFFLFRTEMESKQGRSTLRSKFLLKAPEELPLKTLKPPLQELYKINKEEKTAF